MGANGNIHPTRIFKSPDDLLKKWKEYKTYVEEVESLKWQKIQYVGRDGERVTDKYKVPLTIEGFKVYCFNNKIGTVWQYFENKDGYYNDFVEVCTHIKNETRFDQITGGLLNMYNPSITQRLNNLVEKTEDVTPQQPKKLKITIKKKTDEAD